MSMHSDKQPEDLREYYITPVYLQTMEQRAKFWSADFIRIQLQQFLETIPDYPEVLEILEGELHRRKLNEIKKKARRLTSKELKDWIRKLEDPDHIEVAETELQIRQGVSSLPDASA